MLSVLERERAPEDGDERDLRPPSFDEYVGQVAVKNRMRIYVAAALARGEPLDHVLLGGPPGTGKTTMAMLLSAELGAPCQVATATAFRKAEEIAEWLIAIRDPGTVCFVDEIHRLPRAVEEALYGAMEDWLVDRPRNAWSFQGGALRKHDSRTKIHRFTLVGATTKPGVLSPPLRDRFGIREHMQLYSIEELAQIVRRSANILGVPLGGDDPAPIIGRAARGTPRIANRLLRRARDFVHAFEWPHLDAEGARKALETMEVDEDGLDLIDRRLLSILGNVYGGKPVGVETLALMLSVDEDDVEAREGWLIESGLMLRTPQGRVISPKGLERLEK